MHAHLLNAQQRRPELAQSLFSDVGWSNVVVGNLQFRFWQGPGVELAVAGYRETVYRHKGRGYHISGQLPAQLLSQRIAIHWLVGNIPGNQVIGPVLGGCLPGTGQYHRLADTVETSQTLLYFAGFNPQAADFNLLILTANVEQLTSVQPAYQVTGTIEPVVVRVVGKRIVDKGFCRQLRPVQIARCQWHSAKIQRPVNAYRHRVEPVVQHVEPGIGNPLADRHIGQLTVMVLMGGYVDRRLGRAVNIVKTSAVRQCPVGQTSGQRLANAGQHTHTDRHGPAVLLQPQDDLFQNGGNHNGDRDTVPLNYIQQQTDILPGVLAGNHRWAGGGHTPEHLPDGGIKTVGGALQEDILILHSKALLTVQNKIDH